VLLLRVVVGMGLLLVVGRVRGVNPAAASSAAAANAAASAAAAAPAAPHRPAGASGPSRVPPRGGGAARGVVVVAAAIAVAAGARERRALLLMLLMLLMLLPPARGGVGGGRGSRSGVHLRRRHGGRGVSGSDGGGVRHVLLADGALELDLPAVEGVLFVFFFKFSFFEIFRDFSSVSRFVRVWKEGGREKRQVELPYSSSSFARAAEEAQKRGRKKKKKQTKKQQRTATASAFSTALSSVNVTKPKPREMPSFRSTTQSSMSPNCAKWSRKVSSSISPVPPTKSLRPSAAAAAALVAADELLLPAEGGTVDSFAFAAAAAGEATTGTSVAGALAAAVAFPPPERGTAVLASTRLPLIECGPLCFFFPIFGGFFWKMRKEVWRLSFFFHCLFFFPLSSLYIADSVSSRPEEASSSSGPSKCSFGFFSFLGKVPALLSMALLKKKNEKKTHALLR